MPAASPRQAATCRGGTTFHQWVQSNRSSHFPRHLRHRHGAHMQLTDRTPVAKVPLTGLSSPAGRIEKQGKILLFAFLGRREFRRSGICPQKSSNSNRATGPGCRGWLGDRSGCSCRLAERDDVSDSHPDGVPPRACDPLSARQCVASSSENPFQPKPGYEDSPTRPGAGFGEGSATTRARDSEIVNADYLGQTFRQNSSEFASQP